MFKSYKTAAIDELKKEVRELNSRIYDLENTNHIYLRIVGGTPEHFRTKYLKLDKTLKLVIKHLGLEYEEPNSNESLIVPKKKKGEK